MKKENKKSMRNMVCARLSIVVGLGITGIVLIRVLVLKWMRSSAQIHFRVVLCFLSIVHESVLLKTQRDKHFFESNDNWRKWNLKRVKRQNKKKIKRSFCFHRNLYGVFWFCDFIFCIFLFERSRSNEMRSAFNLNVVECVCV